MTWLVLSLVAVSFAIAWPTAALVRWVSARAGAFDSAGVAGQQKAAARRVPNTGGIAIFWAIVLPILVGLLVIGQMDASPGAQWREDPTLLPADLHEHVAGVQERAPDALLLIACLAVLHVLGLIDDRRPMGPWVKLAIMAVPAIAAPIVLPETRLLTFLDARVGVPWLSIAITALWLLVVTNAMNFMDNMDGLAAGATAIVAACTLAASLLSEQWFVSACLALVVGACGGFLMLNAPRAGGARIFMGDGGSLVLGFLVAFLAVRTTYYAPPGGGVFAAGAWHGVLMPLVVLAVPLYDFTSVVVIRVSQGRSPFVGDLQHVSHRLVGRGLTRAAAVGVVLGFTLVTGLAGVLLVRVDAVGAALIGGQVVALLCVIAAFEYASRRGERSA